MDRRKSMLAMGLVLFGVAPLQESPTEASRLAREMMATWRESAGEERWKAWQAEEAAVTNAAAQEPAQPTKFTAQDQLLWKQEEEKWIAEGYRNFHSSQALGGTIGISCDMCHPDAANTHAETYPKFQTQSKKVSLLRDMINWCIENPMKGKPLPENDPRLRSVEACLLSTRRGLPLEPGKH
jgi:cytochrome c